MHADRRHGHCHEAIVGERAHYSGFAGIFPINRSTLSPFLRETLAYFRRCLSELGEYVPTVAQAGQKLAAGASHRDKRQRMQTAALRGADTRRAICGRCGWGCRVDPGTGVCSDVGFVILRCRSAKCGGAWVGIDQVLARCGECCGLPMPYLRHCAFSVCKAYQTSPNIEQM